MKEVTYERGNISITDNYLHIHSTSINLAKIDNMNTVVFDRHSYFSNFKYWLTGLVILFVVCCFIKSLEWLFTVYILSIVILVGYNIYMHRKEFFGLKIQTSAGMTIYLKSDQKQFIFEIQEIILKAANKKNANYVINLDSHDIINNGIISKGNNNENKIHEGKKA